MSAPYRQITLHKGEHRFIFRWPPGREIAILNAIADCAGHAGDVLDYCDAAVLYHQVGLQTRDPEIRTLCGVWEA